MDNKVYIESCFDYQDVEETFDRLLDNMDGMGSFAREGERIVLKVNLLQPAAPEKAVTTHPALVAAVARRVKEEGAVPIIAESPGSGFPHNKKSLETIYRACGMDKVAEEEGIKLNYDPAYEVVSFPEGKLIKRFEVITPVLEADGVFNLCKLKTHLFMHMTGAVKNSFGVIPGLTKPGYHEKLHDKAHFADMLLDLSEFVSPRLSVMDAVIALQGEGPGAAGTPRHVGLLMASQNPLALDVAAGEIIGLKRENNPILMAAEKCGLFPNRVEDIEVVGVDIAELRIPNYKFPATIFEGAGMGGLNWYQKMLEPLFKTGLSLKPVVDRKRCTACGVCRDACPVKAITVVDDRYAQIDEKKCIRCYCCHEMCVYNAVKLHKSLLYRAMNRQ
ncbi:MAG: DUF362 domain-containing protein [bacterium]|nr:DUF362 domain-containing protein [bacterium]